MWIKGLKSELMDVLQVVIRAVKSKTTTLPAMLGILLEAKEGKLKAFATDLEISLIKEISINVISEGKIVIPARYFFDVVKNLPEAVIELKADLENRVLALNCEGNSFIFNTFQVEEFPREPERPKGEFPSITLETSVLSELLQSVVKSASKDGSRESLNGVFLKMFKGGLEACATDTYRLALRKIAVKSAQEVKEVILPVSVVEETVKLLTEAGGRAKVIFLDNQLLIETSSFTEFSRLIAGQFPNYQGFIPEEVETAAVVSREELIEGLKRLQVFSDAGTVEFKLEEEKLSLSATSQTVGKGTVVIGVEVSGPELTLGFNSSFLQDGLRSMKGEKVKIGLQSEEKPALFTSPEDKNFFYLVMPVRMP